jgi:hypothetical protein
VKRFRILMVAQLAPFARALLKSAEHDKSEDADRRSTLTALGLDPQPRMGAKSLPRLRRGRRSKPRG